MKLDDAKYMFINSWGSLGSQWGINRTMAQIHAFLLLADDPVCTEDIMESLSISRGNANMNIRQLIDWGLVYKKIIRGERKEFFLGEKDLQIVTKRVVHIRRQKELAPMLTILQDLNDTEITGDKEEVKEFIDKIENINSLAIKADKVIEKIEKSDKSWMWKVLFKIIK